MEMGRKRLAVLVGCNYPGTEAELQGCINDVVAMHEMLVQRFGFVPSDIAILTDAENGIVDQPEYPSGENIKRTLSDMIKYADVGDVLLFHFSGHGSLLENQHDDGIYPSDGNIITDYDFRAQVDLLPKGASLTILSDSCYSGGLIDKEKEQIGGDLTDNSGVDQTTDNSGVDQVTDNSGEDQVTENSGENQVTDNSGENQVTDNSNGNSHHRRRHRNRHHKHGKAKGIGQDEMLKHLRSMSGLDSDNIGDHVVHLYGDAASPVFRDEAIPEAKVQLHPDNGILISGCEGNELSRDIPGEMPHGAFTDALLTVLKEHEGPITYEELARRTRSRVSGQGLDQHPCLYSSDANKEAPFLFEGWN